MTDSLEDILGGVEAEIRRAEERLQLDVFRAAPSAGECKCEDRSRVRKEYRRNSN